MPQDKDVQDALQGMEQRDWLERDEWYVCRVALGGDDQVELLAVSGRITDHLEDLTELAGEVMPADDQTGTMEAIHAALSGDLPERAWRLLDQMLTEHIRDWDLSTCAEKHGWARPPRPPAEFKNADERLEMLQSLPIPLLARIIYGLAWHSGNF